MKKGDKIVCINTKSLSAFNGVYKGSVKKIKENETYTVVDRGHSYDIILKEVPGTFYLSERFVSLQYYRMMKLKKLKKNMNEIETNNT